MLPYLLIPLLAFLNFTRGGLSSKVLPAFLPGRALFYVAPAVALSAWTVLPWPQALGVGAAFLLWGSLGWGRWFSLGRNPRSATGRPPSAFERAVERIGGQSDHVCFTIRNVVLLLPAAYLAWWFPLLAVYQLVAYEVSWSVMQYETGRIGPVHIGAIGLAELLTGMGWGWAIIVLAGAG